MSTTSTSRAREQSNAASLTLEVTTRCNRDCVYCYNAWKAHDDYPREELSAQEMIALVRQAIDTMGFGRVQISGGEPLLRPDLFPLIAGIRALGCRVTLVTDGALIDDSVATSLRRQRVGPVQPTLLAADRDLHDELKGGRCFDDTIEGIVSLLRHKVPVTVATLCTSRNYQSFRDVVELCFALGVNHLAFNRLCVVGRVEKDGHPLLPTSDMIASCLEVAQWAVQKLKMKIAVAISLPLCCVDGTRFPDLSLGRCSLLSKHPGFTIDPAGNLRACSVSSTILGSLRHEGWSEILSRAVPKYFSQVARVPGVCRDCPSLNRCGGGCRESARGWFSSWDHPDPLARPGLR